CRGPRRRRLDRRARRLLPPARDTGRPAPAARPARRVGRRVPPRPRARARRAGAALPRAPPGGGRCCDAGRVIERRAQGGTLILGGGFAGAYVARLIGRRGSTIVSPENFVLYTPMLPEAASGTLEPRHAVVPLRQMCPHAELLLGRGISVDLEARTAQIETDVGTQTISWRELVLALGAVPRVAPVP